MDNNLIEQYKRDLMRMYRTSPNARNQANSSMMRSSNMQQFSQNPTMQQQMSGSSAMQQPSQSTTPNRQRNQDGITQNGSTGRNGINQSNSQTSGMTPRTDNQPVPDFTSIPQNQSSPFSVNELIDPTTANQPQTSRTNPPQMQGDRAGSQAQGVPQIQSTPTTVVSPVVDPNSEIGRLIGIVTTINTLFPVPNARITIFTGPYDSMEVVARTVTDESGRTQPIQLYAPPRSNSLTPGNQGPAFAEYNMLVQADGYVDNIHLKIPVYSGVTSLQRSNLQTIEAAGNRTSPFVFSGPPAPDL